MNEYISVLKKYFEFSGRAGRREYWLFTLFNFLIVMGIGIVASVVSSMSESLGMLVNSLSSLYSLAVLLPSLGVSVRRLHDVNKSGWFLLLVLLPLVGPIILLVFAIMDGTKGENKYGPDPKGQTTPAMQMPQADSTTAQS